ncbi:MAG: hypothetical protein ABMA01_18230 [Chthoniobacteraceae bacterium]
MFCGTTSTSREGDPIDRRDPAAALAELEDAVEQAASHFADDALRDPVACAAAVSVIHFLLPAKIGDRHLGEPGLAAIGRRCLALGILLKFVSEDCADLARIFGGTRATFSAAMIKLAGQLGMNSPFRSDDARQVYRSRAKAIWTERHDAGLSKAGHLKRKGAAPEGTAPEVNHFNGEAESEVTHG